MSLELRVETLERELFKVRKLLHKKDENQHEVWNNLQERILDLCKGNAEDLVDLQRQMERLDSKVQNLDTRMEIMESKIQNMDTRMETMESKIQNMDSHIQRMDTHLGEQDSKLNTVTDILHKICDKIEVSY